MSTALAYETLDFITENPEKWNQGAWFAEWSCGTVGCYAGWATILSGCVPADGDYVLMPDGSRLSVSDAANHVLGIEGVQHDMFDPDNTLEDLEYMVARIFGPRPAPIRTEDETRRSGLELAGSCPQ